MSIRKLAAQTMLLQAFFLIALLGIYAVVMTGIGMQMSDWDSPMKSAQFLVNHKSIFTLTYFFDWVFAVTTFILAAVMTQRFSRRQPWLSVLIGGWGVISAALFLAAGSIGIFGVHAAVAQYTSQAGLGLAITMQQLQFIIESSAIAAVGGIIFLSALASARTHAFAAWINWCGYITGVFYVVSFIASVIVPSLGFLGFLGVITAILFNIGVAMNFIKQPNEELTLAMAN